MKILIWGSMSFAHKMMEIQKTLETGWHEVSLSPDIDFFLKNPKEHVTLEQELEFCRRTGVMKKFFDEIAQHEAILFLNYEKKWIPGYIGASVLMEIGIAYYLGKKIYLINDIDRTQSYALEVLVTDPVVINEDLTLIH